jgi:hypothetical protein
MAPEENDFEEMLGEACGKKHEDCPAGMGTCERAKDHDGQCRCVVCTMSF